MWEGCNMKRLTQLWLAASMLAGLYLAGATSASFAQQRYTPSRPTVSPYLDLFRPRVRGGQLPNYYTFVRPQLRQSQINQSNQQVLQQQSQAIQQLQSSFQQGQQGQAGGPLVAPTGKGSWFARPGSRSTFLNTSRYYSQSGSSQRR